MNFICVSHCFLKSNQHLQTFDFRTLLTYRLSDFTDFRTIHKPTGNSRCRKE